MNHCTGSKFAVLSFPWAISKNHKNRPGEMKVKLMAFKIWVL
jgi:hypothetical protein